jgi:hypothetical protein
MKAMLPGVFPERAFSTRYAIKDLSYALEMAEASGLDMVAAKLTMARLRQADAAGYGDQYHPVVLRVIDRDDVLPENGNPRAQPAGDASA